MYMLMIRPNSVLDVFAGLESWYLGRVDNLVTNDKEQEADTTYHKDAFSLMCMLYDKGETFDVIDLDPFGSAYDCFDLAIKMAKKGLVITFGELGHKRWKRLDYVRNHYGIYNINDFTLSRLIEYVQSIGRRNKKQLNVVFRKEWQNIGRVWFEIERYKTTEQWGIDNKEEKTYVATGRFQMLIDAEDDYEAANILFDTHNITFSDVEIREDETG